MNKYTKDIAEAPTADLKKWWSSYAYDGWCETCPYPWIDEIHFELCRRKKDGDVELADFDLSY